MRLPIRHWNGEERLSDRSIEAETARLRTARPRREFERIIDRMGRNIPAATLIVGRSGKAFREAWIACEFARAINAAQVQLADDGAPDDFYLKSKGRPWQAWQATEAILRDHGRKRAINFREKVPEHGGVTLIEEDDAEIRRQSAGALPAILERLADKSLSACGGRLVIYWNTGWLIGGGKLIETLRIESEPYRTTFAEAWLIGKRSLVRLAPDFEMVRGPPASLGG